jgi:glycosyltransferase involved in cell wall biosynthesis
MTGNPDSGRLKVVIFSRDPPILIGAVEGTMSVGPASVISPLLKGRAFWLLLKLSWSIESSKMSARIIADYRRHAQEYPEHRIVYLCNTARELFLLQQCNVPSILCNHNIFVCEKTFNVQGHQTKEFDAIYNARPAPYKRHELCRDVPRVGLIYYAPNPEDVAYIAGLKEQLPNAVFVNELEARRATSHMSNPKVRAFIIETFTRNHYIALPPEVVTRYCNRAHVGLCLSATEGAMLASIEYLLCGLPVVSTINRGGRDFFFDPEFCITVPPDPAAVARAVEELSRRKISPEYVREKTLRKMLHDRNKFLGFVQAIYQHEATSRDVREDWERSFVTAMTGFVKLDELLGAIKA